MAFAPNLRMPIPARPRPMTEAETDVFYETLFTEGGDAARVYRDRVRQETP